MVAFHPAVAHDVRGAKDGSPARLPRKRIMSRHRCPFASSCTAGEFDPLFAAIVTGVQAAAAPGTLSNFHA